MILFITGGTGFFGRALLRHLIKDSMGYERVIVLTRSPENFFEKYRELSKSPLLTFVKGDVTDSYLSWEGASDVTPNHIIHAATESGISHNLDPLYLSRQIVRGTENVLDYAAQTGTQRLLYVSSGAAYGSSPEGVLISEEMQSAPDTLSTRSVYGNAKRLAENMCMAEARRVGFECVVSRCFSFVGKDMPTGDNFALGSFLKAVKANRDIVINGDGLSVRSYLDQNNLALALLRLTASGRSGEIYNVGSEDKISILQLAEKIKYLYGSQVEIHCKNGVDRGLAANWYVPDISKLKAELNFNFQTDFDETIRKIISQ